MTSAVLDGTWDSLKKIAVRHAYPAKTVLFQQGDPVPVVFLVERGAVKLLHWENEDRPVVVGLRHSDWVLGAVPAMLGEPQIVTAETVTPCFLWNARQRCL